MLIAILSTLVLTIATSSWRTRVRTYRAEVHEAGEGDDPEVLGVDEVTTMELQGGDVNRPGR